MQAFIHITRGVLAYKHRLKRRQTEDCYLNDFFIVTGKLETYTSNHTCKYDVYKQLTDPKHIFFRVEW